MDGGLNNYTFTANGIIEQAAWDAISDGTLTLTFYASDIFGNTGSADVIIKKNPQSGGAIGLDYFMTKFLIFIAGGMGVIVVIVKLHSKKRIKFT